MGGSEKQVFQKMTFRYILSPFAEEDLDAIHEWYQQCDENVFKRFDKAISEKLTSILSNPHQNPIIHRDIRRAVMKKFPYSIFYQIIEDRIIILSVLHHKRNPRVWKKRTK